MYPSKIDKLSVNLALKIFDVNNDIALKSVGGEINLMDYKYTIQFIKIIRKYWNIMNISHLNKGHYKNCNSSNPFTSLSDERFLFLEKNFRWINSWKKLGKIILSGEPE